MMHHREPQSAQMWPHDHQVLLAASAVFCNYYNPSATWQQIYCFRSQRAFEYRIISQSAKGWCGTSDQDCGWYASRLTKLRHACRLPQSGLQWDDPSWHLCRCRRFWTISIFWRGLSVLRDMSRTVEGFPSSAELCQIASQKELVNNPWRHLWLSPSAKGHVLAQLILWRSHTALCVFSQFHQELGFLGLAPQIACIAHVTDTSSMQHRTVCSCGNSAAGAKSWRLEDREGRLVHVN